MIATLIVRQPWSDGRVGTFGWSALAQTQVATAFLAHPAHRAMSPGVLPYGMMSRLGGAYLFTQIPMYLYFTHSGKELRPYQDVDWMSLLNTLPVVDLLNAVGGPVELFRSIVTAPHTEDYFGLAQPENFRRLHTPCLLISGWFDHCLTGAVDFFMSSCKYGSAAQRENTRLIIGPWDHSRGELEYDFGPDSRVDVHAVERDFFARYLGATDPRPSGPPVRLFIMGRNVWRDENEFPLRRAVPTNFYLHSGGAAHSRPGWGTLTLTAPGRESPDGFTYDPARPVPAVGGANPGPARVLPMKRGPRNQCSVLRREDVLVFVSEPLQAPLEVTGPLQVVLFAASSAPDTDFTAKLMDVSSEDDWLLLQDGIVRARYRQGVARPQLLTPGQVERYEIDLWFTSCEFQPGHRIGLAISSSNFPRFSRNLNTGGDNEREARFVQARQTIYHDAARPSHVVLPVVPPS